MRAWRVYTTLRGCCCCSRGPSWLGPPLVLLLWMEVLLLALPLLLLVLVLLLVLLLPLLLLVLEHWAFETIQACCSGGPRADRSWPSSHARVGRSHHPQRARPLPPPPPVVLELGPVGSLPLLLGKLVHPGASCSRHREKQL